MFSLPPPEKPLWAAYSPGYWKQDLLTFPIEIGLDYIVVRYDSQRAVPLWPFSHENPNLSQRPTTLSGSVLAPYAAAWTVFTYGALKISNPSFPLYANASGLLHTITLTNLVTSAFKTVFQRKRPFYNTQETPTRDSRLSFFSEHASQSFAFAAYTSGMVFDYSQSRVVGVLYAAAAYSAASYIAYSRVRDHAHNRSDVFVGALVGTLLGNLLFFRTQQVVKEQQDFASEGPTGGSYSFQVLPIVQGEQKTTQKQTGLMVSADYDF